MKLATVFLAFPGEMIFESTTSGEKRTALEWSANPPDDLDVYTAQMPVASEDPNLKPVSLVNSETGVAFIEVPKVENDEAAQGS